MYDMYFSDVLLFNDIQGCAPYTGGFDSFSSVNTGVLLSNISVENGSLKIGGTWAVFGQKNDLKKKYFGHFCVNFVGQKGRNSGKHPPPDVFLSNSYYEYDQKSDISNIYIYNPYSG